MGFTMQYDFCCLCLKIDIHVTVHSNCNNGYTNAEYCNFSVFFVA